MILLPNMGIIYIINIILPYLVIIMCRGIPGGEENGKKGYMLTFVIAYIRVRMRVIIIMYSDILCMVLTYYVLGESMVEEIFCTPGSVILF